MILLFPAQEWNINIHVLIHPSSASIHMAMLCEKRLGSGEVMSRRRKRWLAVVNKTAKINNRTRYYELWRPAIRWIAISILSSTGQEEERLQPVCLSVCLCCFTWGMLIIASTLAPTSSFIAFWAHCGFKTGTRVMRWHAAGVKLNVFAW